MRIGFLLLLKRDTFIFRLMKIATWNVNGIRASFNKGLEDFVQKYSPDILCLQETKAHPDQLDQKLWLSEYYPYSDWTACGVKKGYSGTATFSKNPATRIRKGMGIKKFDWEGRILISEYSSFILLNIYFPNGAMTEERHLFKQEFLYRITLFVKSLEKTEKKGLIILGITIQPLWKWMSMILWPCKLSVAFSLKKGSG